MRYLIFLCLFFCASTAFAQEESQSVFFRPKQKVDEENRARGILADELRGIYFYSDYKRFTRRDDKPKEFEGIYIEEGLLVPVEKDFARRMRSFLNKPVTLDLLDALKLRIQRYYRNEGYPIVAVIIPEGQKISSERLEVVIKIAKVGDVRAQGAKWYSNDWINRQISLQEGEYVQTAPLLADINWINRNPFINSSLVFEKGQHPFETDVIVLSDNAFPLRAYGGYENSGYIIGGFARYKAGLNVGRLFFQNDQLNAEFSNSPHLKKWWAVTGSYSLPLPWRHLLKSYFLYSKTEPNLPDEPEVRDPFRVAAMNELGKFWQYGFRYIMTLPTFTHYTHELRFGYDFKRTNNFLNYNPELIFTNFFDISEFVGIYEGRVYGSWGFAIIGLTFVGSPGNMTKYNKDAIYDLVRVGAKANYMYGRGSLDVNMKLPWGFTWDLSFVGQVASGKLLPTEELSIGGFLTVRGYDENELISEEGFIVRNELRTPTFPMMRHFKVNDQMQFLAFFDFGDSIGIDPNVLENHLVTRNDDVLASFGPGMRYTIEDYLSFRLDYGFQLHTITNRPYTSGHRRMHLGLTVSF